VRDEAIPAGVAATQQIRLKTRAAAREGSSAYRSGRAPTCPRVDRPVCMTRGTRRGSGQRPGRRQRGSSPPWAGLSVSGPTARPRDRLHVIEGRSGPSRPGRLRFGRTRCRPGGLRVGAMTLREWPNGARGVDARERRRFPGRRPGRRGPRFAAGEGTSKTTVQRALRLLDQPSFAAA
jgi:hypothetical protein